MRGSPVPFGPGHLLVRRQVQVVLVESAAEGLALAALALASLGAEVSLGDCYFLVLPVPLLAVRGPWAYAALELAHSGLQESGGADEAGWAHVRQARHAVRRYAILVSLTSAALTALHGFSLYVALKGRGAASEPQLGAQLVAALCLMLAADLAIAAGGFAAVWRQLRHDCLDVFPDVSPTEPRLYLSMRYDAAIHGSTCCEPMCSICLDEFRPLEDLAQLPCGHLFHEECLVKWLIRDISCPLRCNLRPLKPLKPAAFAAARGPLTDVPIGRHGGRPPGALPMPVPSVR